MPRSVATWVDILRVQDATHRSAEEAAADRILEDLIGYRKAKGYRENAQRQEDVKQLAAALQAYVNLCKKAGL